MYPNYYCTSTTTATDNSFLVYQPCAYNTGWIKIKGPITVEMKEREWSDDPPDIAELLEDFDREV